MTPARLAAAYTFDLLAGDPEWFPHPVRGFGALIETGERNLRRAINGPLQELVAGAALTASVTSFAWFFGRPGNPAWQIALAWTALATRSLLDEAGSVVRALEAQDLPLARTRLARIVGRDTAALDESEISRAVIETLAESACDGIVAPLFWLAVLGVPGAMAFKAISTLDSMIGHREQPYRYFGRAAARLDDVVNLVPARLTALLIVIAARMQALNAASARDIWLRDGNLHASPNAGQSEAAMAGALGVTLGGRNTYDGQPHQSPLMNGEGRKPAVRDARSALTTVAIVSGIAAGLAVLFLFTRRRK
jgi:adenosylcobinamide-phosphate synthase